MGPENRTGVNPSELSLSPRDRRMLVMKAQGWPNKLIGRELGFSPHTVKNGLTSIWRRLGQNSSFGGIMAALNLGILNLEEIVGGFDLKKVAQLSPKQRKFLEVIIETNASTREMAARLGCSLSTLKNKLTVINHELGVNNRIQAAFVYLAARREGILSTQEEEQPRPKLTKRQLEILKLSAGGYQEEEIAESLGIAPSTVKGRKSLLLKKLGVRTILQAVLLGIETRILDPGELVTNSELERMAYLSPRQLKILKTAISKNGSQKEVADSLGLAPKTIVNQLSHIYEILGVHNLTRAVVVYLSNFYHPC